MVKQRRFHQVTRQGAKALPAVCLSAFLVFGNAVSAFGNDTAAARAKSRASSAKAATEKTAEAPKDETASATPAPTTQPRKAIFRKIGEPFVVSTAGETETTQ